MQKVKPRQQFGCWRSFAGVWSALRDALTGLYRLSSPRELQTKPSFAWATDGFGEVQRCEPADPGILPIDCSFVEQISDVAADRPWTELQRCVEIDQPVARQKRVAAGNGRQVLPHARLVIAVHARPKLSLVPKTCLVIERYIRAVSRCRREDRTSNAIDGARINCHAIANTCRNAEVLGQVRFCVSVRRQNIWHNLRRRLAECGPRLGLMFRRRACSVASADVRVSFA